MAVRETLVLELRGALAQLDALERQIDDLRDPVRLDLDVTGDAAREVAAIDDRLDNLVNETQDVNRELAQMENIAARSVDDFSDLAHAMGVTEEHARDITREVREAEDAAARLDNEIGQVARAMGISEKAASELVTELRQAERAADGIGTSAGPSRLVGVFQGAAVAATAAAVGIGLGAKAAFEAVQLFAQLEDSINAVNVVFGDASDSVAEFGETAAESAGLSQTAFNQAVVPIGSLLQNFGFDAREAADASVILVQRAADLASVMGGTVQEALLAVGAALRGEADPLERYGASISAARVEQFALAEGLAKTKAEITPAITLQARYGLILEDTARVSGDFANTSGDLANAQRTAAAEASNLAAAFGESLAPAFEAILAQAPAIIDLFASLNPALAETAGSAAAAAAGLQILATNAVLGSALFGNIAGELQDLAQAGVGFFEDIADAIRFADRDFSHFGDQMDQFTKKEATRFVNMAGLRIPKAIAAGMAPIDAFGEAIASLALRDDDLHTLELGFERLRIQTGLTDEETQRVVRSLLAQADALELNADEIAFLTSKQNELNEALDDGGRANEDYLASIRGIADIPFDTITTRFTTFTSALAEIPAQMDTVAGRTRAAADALGQSLNPFDEPPEDLHVSAQEFFDNVVAEINAEATFQAGIVELILRKQFNLAEMLGKQGPAAQTALTGFLTDLDLAAATEKALATGQTETSEKIGAALTAAIAATPPGPARQALIDFMVSGVIDSPEVEDAIVTGTESAAQTTASSYLEFLEAEVSDFDASILQEKLADLFSGVTFDISADQFNFPDSGAFQGTIGVGAVFTNQGGGGGGTTVNNYIYNPTTTDLPTNVAQANQSTAAVGTALNRVVNS